MTDTNTETKTRVRTSDVDKLQALVLKIAKSIGKTELSKEDLNKVRRSGELLSSTTYHAANLSEYGKAGDDFSDDETSE